MLAAFIKEKIMADQLFDDYGIRTGSPNLFSGGMSKQELDQLLGLSPLSRTEVSSEQTVPLAEAFSTVEVPYRGALDVVNLPANNSQPEPVFTQSPPLNLSAFMPSDLRNNQMTTQDPREYFTSGQQPQQQSVVAGMFPEVEAMQRALYQQKQNEAMQAQAMQFARLDPFQKASYGLAMGGQQLGGAIGSALGGKDPQLQQISMRNAIMKRLDPSDPAQQMKIAQEVVKYDPEFGMSIADNARKSAIQIRQASGYARQGITANVQQAERIATAEGLVGNAFETRVAELLKGTNKLSDKQTTGARVAEITRMLRPETGGLLLRPSERAALEAELATYERPDKQLSFGDQREAYSGEMFDNKSYAELTPSQKGEVNKRIEETRLKEAKATVPSSGIKEYKDIPKLRSDIIATVKPFRDTVNAADNALINIGLSMNENNFIAFNAARVQLAKALAGGDLSQKEIQASGGDPSILGGVFDLASTAISATPSIDTQQKIKNTIKAIRKVALQKGRAEIEAQRTLAKRSNFTDEDFDLASDIPEFRKKPSSKITESDDALINKYLPKKP